VDHKSFYVRRSREVGNGASDLFLLLEWEWKPSFLSVGKKTLLHLYIEERPIPKDE